MQKTLAEIAQIVSGQIVGDAKIIIKGLSGIKEAEEGDLTFLANSKYFHLVEQTKASAILVDRQVTVPGKSVVRVDNPSLAFSKIASIFIQNLLPPFEGIHKTAVIAKDVSLGKNVGIGPHVVIESGVKIGDNTRIGAGCYIGHQVSIGHDCLIYPNITIRERIIIGNRVVIHSGTVIGSDGFGFVSVEGLHEKIPQLGTVEVQDDVEIGANVTVDRARFDKTVIGKGTKIDNLVQIAHNVQIGENCIIVAQVGISGSCTIEDRATLAGQAGLAGHLTIGAGAIVAAQAGVTNSVPPNTIVSGYPAKPHNQAKRVNACLQRLPHYVKIINELKERIKILEERIREFQNHATK